VKPRACLVSIALVSLVLAACAARRPEEPPAAAPAGAERPDAKAPGTTTTPPGYPPSPESAIQPGAEPMPSQAPPAVRPPESADRRESSLRAARSEVDRARGQLEASMSDCTSACRALASLERATGHLCDLATAIEDRRKCEDAKTRVYLARDKIRASCGSCPGGPVLDKSAPIPSFQ
jgi:hypothetical protein